MNKGTAWYRLVRAFCRAVVFRGLGGTRVIQRQNEPLDGALIVAPVHFSFLDPPVVACSLQRAITFMAKEELFKPFLFGPLIRSLGAFPVRRGAGDSEAIRLAIKLLEEGRAVLMFPEGTRGKGDCMGPMTPGVAMLAKRTGARVLPVGIFGTQIVLPKGQSKPRPHRMTVALGESFTWAEICGDSGDKHARELFNEELRKRLLAACAAAGQVFKNDRDTSDPESSPDPEPAIGS